MPCLTNQTSLKRSKDFKSNLSVAALPIDLDLDQERR
ncbi:hypothetical protein EniLVp02_0073 [Vibrio phage EniLVp02]